MQHADADAPRCLVQMGHNPPILAIGCCRHGGRPAVDGEPAKKDTLANIEETGCVQGPYKAAGCAIVGMRLLAYHGLHSRLG